MLVSFDPTDAQERSNALSLIQLYDGQTPAQTVVEAPIENDPEPAATIEPAAVVIDAVAGVELDVNGTPWIEEAHATTKTKTVKGVWKKKRGLEDNTVAALEATAREKIAGTPQPVVPTEPVVAPADIPVEPVTTEMVSTAWQKCLDQGLVDPANAAAIFAPLGVDGSQLGTNETMRVALLGYLDGLLTAPVAAPVQQHVLPGL